MQKNRRYVVMARNPKTAKQGITTGKGHRSFNGKSGMVITDPAEAREIEAAYGKKGTHEIGIVQDERLEWHMDHDRQTDGHNSDIHHYTFSGVDLKGIKRTKKNPYVWVRADGKQKRMLRSEAIEEGFEIVEDKRHG